MQPVTEANSSLTLKEHSLKWVIKNWNVSDFMIDPIMNRFDIPDMNTQFSIVLAVANNLKVTITYDASSNLDQCNIEIYVLEFNGMYYNSKCQLKKSPKDVTPLDKGKRLTNIVFVSTNKYPNYNELHILCEVKYALDSSEVSEPYDRKMSLNGFDKLLCDKKLCDVVFLTGDEKITAHIAVLAAPSPYFLAMFNSPNTIESQKRLVDFRHDKDVTANNLQGFLEFIYGNKSIIQLKNIVPELLILADKFGVEPLRKTCECYLSEHICRENVVDLLLLSDKYRCELLKKKASSFAKKHIDVVKASSKFNELFKVADIIRNLL